MAAFEGNGFTIEPVSDASGNSVIQTDREIKEQLLQYGLEGSLTIQRFRFSGQFTTQSPAECNELLKALFGSQFLLSVLGCAGEPTVPVDVQAEALSLATMTMSFFDRLTEKGVVGPGGRIRGCFDDTFDGITVGDMLREMLLNENSENREVYSAAEQKELIFQLFRLFAVGGELCQPETEIGRYLTLTKAVYKDIVTVYRETKSQAIAVSGKAFRITEVSGVELHPNNTASPHNVCIVVVDPMKRLVTVLKNTHKRFW